MTALNAIRAVDSVITLRAREKVQRLEDAMCMIPQVDCPMRHHFAPGVYLREMTIPAGTVVTGAVHRTENLVIVSAGRVRFLTDDGVKDAVSGDVITCKPGMKNAVVTLEDSRWTNVYPNPDNITDPDILIELFTESKASDLMGGSTNKQLAANKAAQLEH